MFFISKRFIFFATLFLTLYALSASAQSTTAMGDDDMKQNAKDAEEYESRMREQAAKVEGFRENATTVPSVTDSPEQPRAYVPAVTSTAETNAINGHAAENEPHVDAPSRTIASKDLSTSDKIAIGVGVGVGATVSIVVIGVVYWIGLRRKVEREDFNKRTQNIQRDFPENINNKIYNNNNNNNNQTKPSADDGMTEIRVASPA